MAIAGLRRKEYNLQRSYSWKIGRVAGIDLFIHPTFLLVLLFPGVLSGGPGSVLLVLAVFGCVLLHELGHALAARQFGIRTRDITLYPIGGVARMERMPRAAGAELVIALAGPAVNVAIAVGLLALEYLSGGLLFAGSSLGGFLSELLAINVILAVFNMLPAFPMDGGRVLRAFLCAWMSRARATSIAARTGRVMAVLLGTVGFYLTENVMLIPLAIFVYMLSRAEEAHVLAEETRRAYGVDGRGIWVAPSGYRWVEMGNGSWQLAPVVVGMARPRQDASPWL
jgi:Zn-dependent protease